MIDYSVSYVDNILYRPIPCDDEIMHIISALIVILQKLISMMTAYLSAIIGILCYFVGAGYCLYIVNYGYDHMVIAHDWSKPFAMLKYIFAYFFWMLRNNFAVGFHRLMCFAIAVIVPYRTYKICLASRVLTILREGRCGNFMQTEQNKR